MANDDIGAFLTRISSLGDRGAHIVPPEDAKDITNGAESIPYSVTDARRCGQIVNFIHQGSRENWYWEMPDGTKIYHG